MPKQFKDLQEPQAIQYTLPLGQLTPTGTHQCSKCEEFFQTKDMRDSHKKNCKGKPKAQTAKKATPQRRRGLFAGTRFHKDD